MSTTLWIFIIGAIICGAVAVVCYIAHCVGTYRLRDIYYSISIIMAIGCVICLVGAYDSYKREEKIATTIKYAGEGWEIYVNGQLCDLENIVLENYMTEFDEENQKILLTIK